MTREEAKEILEEVKAMDDSMYQYNKAYLEALNMAIEALKQEPCEDCISRQAAIRLAEQGQIQGFMWQIQKLIGLPPVQPKQDWISVTERLPEDKQEILVTRKSEKIECIEWNTWWHEQTRYPSDKVIAWMPLPEPYKENKE